MGIRARDVMLMAASLALGPAVGGAVMVAALFVAERLSGPPVLTGDLHKWLAYLPEIVLATYAVGIFPAAATAIGGSLSARRLSTPGRRVLASVAIGAAASAAIAGAVLLGSPSSGLGEPVLLGCIMLAGAAAGWATAGPVERFAPKLPERGHLRG